MAAAEDAEGRTQMGVYRQRGRESLQTHHFNKG